MNYLVLIYQDPSTFPTDAAGRDQQIAAYETFTQGVRAANTLVAGNPLVPLPDQVRTIAGGTIKSGPPQTRPQALIGFYILDYPTLDAAVTSARAIPAASIGSVEVVPFMEM